MTREQAVERRISEWLHDEAAGQLPDWVLETTFERTRAERQRRGVPWWRTLHVIPRNTTVRIVLVGALLLAGLLGLAIAVGGNAPQTACVRSPGASSAASSSGAAPVDFLWSATGPADDPIRFSRSAYSPGSGPIAIDPACRIWVADTGNGRFAIFDQNGSFIEYWGSPGNGEGQFQLRSSSGDGLGTVAFAPGGAFYVLDLGNNRVQHFDKDRKFLGSWGGSVTASGSYLLPFGLAVDAKGAVYVLDLSRDLVETYDKDGKVLASFSPHLAGINAAMGLALDEHGNILVVACCGSGNEIRKFAPNGTLLATIGSFAGGDPQMTGVAVDAAGRLFTLRSGPAASGDIVRVYDQGGTLVASFGSIGSGDGQFDGGWVQGIALDGQGNVYLTDPGKNRLQKFRLLPPLAP